MIYPKTVYYSNPKRFYSYIVFKYNYRDISMNHIKQLPETLFQSTKNLVLLHLYNNKIEILPKSLFKGLSRLEDLDLSANLLLELSSEIFQGVVSLKRLKLQENQLQQLPLGNMKLIYFYINTVILYIVTINKILAVTGVFDDVEYMEVLSLRNNRISFIRPGLFNNMRRLVYLDLTENWISLVND